MKNRFTRIAEPILEAAGGTIARRHFTRPPIFIGGCGRSGTTLLLSILSAHPDIFAIPIELSLFQDSQITDNGIVTPYMYRLHRELIRRKIKSSANRYCEKSPVNIHYFNEIDAYHSGHFKMIHIIRDGRDVILSRHPRDPNAYWVEPERWINDVRTGLSHRNHPCMLTIHYERLVEKYEPTIRKICTFIGVPVTREILNWHKYATVRRNRALYSPIEEIKDSSIGRWMASEYRERVERLTSLTEGMKLLSELGYTE